MSDIYLCSCGEKMTSKAKFCISCRDKKIRDQVKIEREELKKLGQVFDNAFV